MYTAISTISFLIIMMIVFHFAARRFSSRLNAGGRKRWLTIHVLCVLVYFSGASGMALVYWLSQGTSFEGSELYLHILRKFDYWYIIPFAMGTFLSGAWLCVRTSLGLTRLKWIIAKWVGTLIIVTTGIMCIGNSLDVRFPDLLARGLLPGDPAWDGVNRLIEFGLGSAVVIMIVLVVLSYLKPKGKKA